jgi:hypothetical protein
MISRAKTTAKTTSATDAYATSVLASARPTKCRHPFLPGGRTESGSETARRLDQNLILTGITMRRTVTDVKRPVVDGLM